MLFKKSILPIVLFGTFSLSNVTYAMDFSDVCSNSGGNFVDGSSTYEKMEIGPLLGRNNYYIFNISDDVYTIDLMTIGGKDKINLLQKAIVNSANIDICTKRGEVKSIKITNNK
ncbi:hypothetical protein I3256_08555 [Photobacterium damselae]|uniref:hypothetical protein n=1 Tax=Photobacterium damselae TaxID=38293 RepID=UPI001EDCFC9B|nr:hypothetical protein [Photobacterium damselae]MCG3815988.1 hypothetical protein [Photobacterium damselae]